MNNIEYWEKREKARLENSLKDVVKVEKLLKREYAKAMKEIRKEIDSLYHKYAKDNKLSYFEANRNLMSSEFKVWRMDLKDYIKQIELTNDKQLLLELNALAMKSRISVLEEKLYQIDKYIDEIHRTTLESTTTLLTDTLSNEYYRSIYENHKYVGVGSSFAHIDHKLVQEIISFPWSGSDYKTIINKSRYITKQTIRSEITQMIIRGEASHKVAKRVSKTLDTSLSNASRIINTEHAYVCGQADRLAYDELGVKKYQYLATLDNRTSQTCKDLDGLIKDVSEAVVGVNYPPMHPRCRSTTVPYLDEKYISTCTARLGNGKTYEVPADMTYHEWAELNGL